MSTLALVAPTTVTDTLTGEPSPPPLNVTVAGAPAALASENWRFAAVIAAVTA